MKKWSVGALVFVLLLAGIIAWGLSPSHAITVVTYGGFEVYDVRYFPGTNRIFYWRAAWRDALGLVGLKQRQIQRGPAVVVYSAYPPQVGQGQPLLTLWNNGRLAANMASAESFGTNRLVTKFFLEHAMTNSAYQLTFHDTNVADLTVNFKN